MKIEFDHLMSPALRQASLNFGLDKIAAERCHTAQFHMADALRVIGERLFLKNAEYKNILLGLECLRDLHEGK